MKLIGRAFITVITARPGRSGGSEKRHRNAHCFLPLTLQTVLVLYTLYQGTVDTVPMAFMCLSCQVLVSLALCCLGGKFDLVLSTQCIDPIWFLCWDHGSNAYFSQMTYFNSRLTKVLNLLHTHASDSCLCDHRVIQVQNDCLHQTGFPKILHCVNIVYVTPESSTRGTQSSLKTIVR